MKNRGFAKSDRQKIYKTKKIKDSSSVYVPKAKSNLARNKRFEIIKKSMNCDCKFCNGLNAHVLINRKTIENFRVKSSLKYKSTKAVLNLENILKNATYIFSDKPKKTTSQKKYKKIHILICPIKGIGYTKLSVGEFFECKNDCKYQIYCITAVSLKTIKK